MQYMGAIAVIHVMELWDDGSIVELVVWQLSEPLTPSTHLYKYRLFFGSPGICRVRYDNERGKGDHRHINGIESDYIFTTLERLLDDFEADVDLWRAA